jgi:ABC-type multidrug transport system fused ATPase/permease subunit
MSSLDDLVDKVATLNEAERVEYNRRLQLAKATKELASRLSNDIQGLDRLISQLTLFSTTARTIFFCLFCSIFVIAANTDGRLLWLGSLVVLAVVIVLIDSQKNVNITQRSGLQQQSAVAERDWAGIGLEISFLHAILEMEANMHSKDASFQNLQNINSSQAERKRTLSHYDYQIRNEILLNIQNEKNWWSKIDVLTNRWFNLK